MSILQKFFLNIIFCFIVMALLNKFIFKNSLKDTINIPNTILFVAITFFTLKGYEFSVVLLISGIAFIVASVIFK